MSHEGPFEILCGHLRRQDFPGLFAGRLRRKRNIYLDVVAGFRGVDSGSNPFKVKPNIGPLLAGQNHDGNLPVVFEVLLIADVLVGAQKEIITGFFSTLDECPVSQLMPAHLRGARDLMPDKAPGNRSRDAVIKQNFHGTRIGALCRLWLAKWSTAWIWSSETSNSSVIS